MSLSLSLLYLLSLVSSISKASNVSLVRQSNHNSEPRTNQSEPRTNQSEFQSEAGQSMPHGITGRPVHGVKEHKVGDLM